MVTKQAEKKKWVVRCYNSSRTEYLDNEYLEAELNNLTNDGYTLYMIDYDRSRVIGYLKEESGFLKLLSSGRNVEEEKKGEEDDPLLNFKSSNPMTNPLLANLIVVMDARSSGDPHTEIRVSKLVEQAMKRGSLNDAYGTADDLIKLLGLHKAHVARVSDDKKPCSDACSVNVVLEMAAAKLRAYLTKHPMS